MRAHTAKSPGTAQSRTGEHIYPYVSMVKGAFSGRQMGNKRPEEVKTLGYSQRFPNCAPRNEMGLQAQSLPDRSGGACLVHGVKMQPWCTTLQQFFTEPGNYFHTER